MEYIMEDKEQISLEIPENVKKSGIYDCKRVINGIEDSLSIFIFLEEEFDEARKNADKIKALNYI